MTAQVSLNLTEAQARSQSLVKVNEYWRPLTIQKIIVDSGTYGNELIICEYKRKCDALYFHFIYDQTFDDGHIHWVDEEQAEE